jgi:hypothetical protein
MSGSQEAVQRDPVTLLANLPHGDYGFAPALCDGSTNSGLNSTVRSDVLRRPRRFSARVSSPHLFERESFHRVRTLAGCRI